MTTENLTEERQREERARREKEPKKRDKGWKGAAAENAERQRGTGRGLDEPERSVPPDELR